MEYANLGLTGPRVSRLAFGCEQLGGTDWGRYEVREVMDAVAAAWEQGVTTFDVADVYGLGLAEERLAQALGAARRDAIIVTKFGVGWRSEGGRERATTFRDASPEHLVRALEGSLRRLRIDCIPVYLLHWPDGRTPLESTLEALQRQREAGKIRSFGLSNCTSADVAILARAGAEVVECEYSLAHAHDTALLEAAARAGVGTLAYGVLARGMLTGKFGRDSRFGPGDRRRRLPDFGPDALERSTLLTRALAEIGEGLGRTPAQVAIRWALDTGSVSCAIVGSKTRDQLAANLGAVGWTLPADAWRLLADDAKSLWPQHGSP